MGTVSNRDSSFLLEGLSRREFLKLSGAIAAGLLMGYKTARGADAALR